MRTTATLLLLGLYALPICAQRAPVTTLKPQGTSGGQRNWTFTAEWNPELFNSLKITDAEIWLRDTIGRDIAARKLCSSGWEVTSRRLVDANMVIEGRCKPA